MIVAKEAVKNVLKGVTGLNGALGADPALASLPVFSRISPMGDTMHNGGGHAKHVLQQAIARLPTAAQKVLMEKLRTDGGHKPKMRMKDWVLSLLMLRQSDAYLGVALSEVTRDHAAAAADLRRLLYMHSDRVERSRGYVLSVMCAARKFATTLSLFAE